MIRVPAQVAYRTANWDTPLWASPNVNDARFNLRNTGPTQYLALHPLTAWAEQVRVRERQLGRSLTPADLTDPGALHRLWLIKIPESQALDLNFDSAQDVGLDPLDLIDDSHMACQKAGEKFRLNGTFPKVWRYPSAAIPGTYNLVIFAALRITQFQREPKGSRWPASLGAHAGRVPVEVLSLTRHIGGQRANHASYVAWKAGGEAKFTEPTTFVWP
jgi:hypothetical protein